MSVSNVGTCLTVKRLICVEESHALTVDTESLKKLDPP